MIDVSLVASAIRVDRWKKFCESVSKDKVRTEIIFVGPTEPKEKMPSNFKFIKTNVKPMQCYEIGYREAKGEVLQSTVDDAIYERGTLDSAFELYKKNGNRKAMIGLRFHENEDPEYDAMYKIFPTRDDSPLGSIFFMLNREYFRSLGGFDRRFICGQADNDIRMRVLSDGGEFVLCKETMVHLMHMYCHTMENNAVRHYHLLHDNKLFEEMWKSGKRDSELQLYEDKDLLLKTQGEKAIWS